MPNIGTALREEIRRLSRQQSRTQSDPIKKVTSTHRQDIALLKRQVATLERQVKILLRRPPKTQDAPTADVSAPKSRFVAKGLRSQRNRLGLSAADLGKIIGVSAQSVYNWESGKARPRQEQMAKLSRLRQVGKRQVTAFLQQLPAAESGAGPKK